MNKILSLLALLLLASCSVTSHLPEGEVLYTGVDRIGHDRVDTIDDVVAEVVATTLEVQPNSAFLGSAYRMSALPIGLWVYNGLYTDREKGLRHWLWQHFKSDPTLVSQVNPRLRAQAAVAALKDEGYFDARVTFDTLYHPHDSLRAKIAYDVTYHHHSRFGSITVIPSRSAGIDSILRHTQHLSHLHTGQRFSSSSIEAERQRITSTLHDSGYFFFSPDHIRFMADSTRLPNTVDLRILIGVGADAKALAPCTIDSVRFHLDHGVGLASQNHDTLSFVTIGYNGPSMVKPQVLRRSLGFNEGALYSPERIELAKTLLSRLNTFKYTTTEFVLLRAAGDTLNSELSTLNTPLSTQNSLALSVSSVYALPWQGTTEIGCVYKDNQHIGPGATVTAMRRNLWGGGEMLSFQLTGSYEWHTGYEPDKLRSSLLNSYELGSKVSVSVPRLQLPHLFQPNSEKPVSSTYSLSFDWMRRGPFFEMIRAGGSIEYGFSFDRRNTLVFTPLRLTYVSLVKTTDEFRVALSNYPSLKHSFENQFIPQMIASWTYDNASTTAQRASSQWLNITLSEAGGLTDAMMGHWGKHREQGQRQLFYQPFSQFFKATAEFRNLHRLSRQFSIASRVQAGFGYAYGNSVELPYAEKFYIGGPNSLRGFAVRGIGPGNYFVAGAEKGAYDYLNRVGDIKLEGNVELRFPIAGILNGALFVDAGNVWVKDDQVLFMSQDTHGSKGINDDFLRQLALDTGFGLRLDLGMLILRFDVGVPLHDPNSSGPSYFNRRHGLLKHIEYNLAVGYPF